MKRHYDFQFTTLIMIQEFSDFGFYFRFLDDANFYVLTLKPAGVSVHRVKGGS